MLTISKVLLLQSTFIKDTKTNSLKLTSIGIVPPPHIGSHTVSPDIILHILQVPIKHYTNNKWSLVIGTTEVYFIT